MNLFQRYLADEFAEDYSEGRISRREALKLIASVTGSILLADSILTGCAAPESTPAAATPPTESSATTSLASPSAKAETVASEAAQPASAPYGTVMPDDPAVIAGEADGPNLRGNVQEVIQEEMAAQGSQPADPLVIEQLPKAQRENAEDYFNRLREGE